MEVAFYYLPEVNGESDQNSKSGERGSNHIPRTAKVGGRMSFGLFLRKLIPNRALYPHLRKNQATYSAAFWLWRHDLNVHMTEPKPVAFTIWLHHSSGLGNRD